MSTDRKKKILIGFDGSVDSSVKPIKTAGTPNVFFSTIGEYGSYIAGKAGLSGSIQIEQVESHAGGNAPYVAVALANMGFDVTLAGMLGKGKILPEFSLLEKYGLKLRSFDDPVFTQCFEFDDGKIMMARQIGFQNDPFGKFIPCLNNDDNLLWDSDLLAMLNWGEIPWMQELWMGAIEYIEKNSIPDMRKVLYIDLADISCRTVEDIGQLLVFLKRATAIRHTILSMNENEMLTLGRVAFDGCSGEKLLLELQKEGYAREIVLHTLTMASACDKSGIYNKSNTVIAKPVISTGAGDNFNAGYCAGTLLELPLDKRLEMASFSVRTYLITGRPVSAIEIASIL